MSGTIYQGPPMYGNALVSQSASYTINLNVSGGIAPYTFTKTFGESVLNISSLGTISTTGILSIGSYFMVGNVTDRYGELGTFFFDLNVDPDTIDQDPPTSDNILVSQSASYTINLNVSGGIAPYTFTKISGDSELIINQSGLISTTGTLSGGDYSINGNVTDSYGYTETFSFTLTVALDPLVCFKEDTKILTDQGYKPIQELRKGDLVKTLKHDFKPIALIGKREIYHPYLKERIKDQLYLCSKTEYPELFQDLIITGCHSILVDNFTCEEQKEQAILVNGDLFGTDYKYRLPACVDKRTTVFANPGTYTIYHLALENEDYYMNYGIYANGLLVESCSKRYLKELSNMELIE